MNPNMTDHKPYSLSKHQEHHLGKGLWPLVIHVLWDNIPYRTIALCLSLQTMGQHYFQW